MIKSATPIVMRLGLMLLTSAALSACAFLPAAQPSSQSESAFDGLNLTIPATWYTDSDQRTLQSQWLDEFQDPQLQALVNHALQQNPSLKASAARVKQAVAGAAIAHSNLLPTLSTDAQASRTRSNVNDANGNLQDIETSRYQLGFDVRWEIDVWGRLDAATRASLARVDQQEALLDSAQLSLAANIAQAWYNLTTASLQLQLNEQQLQNQLANLEIIESSYRSGLNNASDVFLARSDLATQRAVVAESSEQLAQIKRSLQVLLGRYPDLTIELDNATIPSLDHPIPSGIPSTLLTRRPDVIAARARFDANLADIDVADKARYPSFNLTASLGTASSSLSRLLRGDNIIWSLLGSVAQTLFDDGRRDSQLDQAKAAGEEAQADYVSTVLNAFAEVENALSNETTLRTRASAIAEAAEFAKRAYDISRDQYRNGIIDYASLLLAQRQWFSADAANLNIKNQLVQNRIALHLALAGDFQRTDELPAPSTSNSQ